MSKTAAIEIGFGRRGLSPPVSRPRYVLRAGPLCDSSDAGRIAYYRGERDKELAAVDRIDNWNERYFDHSFDPPLDTTAEVRQAHHHMGEMMEHMARAYEGW